MTGEYKPGLYRTSGKTFRFYRVNKSTSGSWTIREYRDGDLNKMVPGSKKELTPTMWMKLEHWQ